MLQLHAGWELRLNFLRWEKAGKVSPPYLSLSYSYPYAPLSFQHLILQFWYHLITVKTCFATHTSRCWVDPRVQTLEDNSLEHCTHTQSAPRAGCICRHEWKSTVKDSAWQTSVYLGKTCFIHSFHSMPISIQTQLSERKSWIVSQVLYVTNYSFAEGNTVCTYIEDWYRGISQ